MAALRHVNTKIRGEKPGFGTHISKKYQQKIKGCGTVEPDFLALKHESMILGQSSNSVCGFSMMEQVKLCAVWPYGELAWLFLEPHIWLHHCPRILLSCLRVRTSVPRDFETFLSLAFITPNWGFMTWLGRPLAPPPRCCCRTRASS